ncbi:MAG: hypothetical protein JST86_04340 [Bacteroidetes bacterium]|nr:hypothetical protein [Bacteroidota bacterium]
MSFKEILTQQNSDLDKRVESNRKLYSKIVEQQNDLFPLGVKSISDGGGYDISLRGYQSGSCISIQLKTKSFFGKLYFLTICCSGIGEFFLDLHYCYGYEGYTVWKRTVKEDEIEKAIIEALQYYKTI